MNCVFWVHLLITNCALFLRQKNRANSCAVLFNPITELLAAPARFAARIALEADSVADHGEGAAVGAGVAFVAF